MAVIILYKLEIILSTILALFDDHYEFSLIKKMLTRHLSMFRTVQLVTFGIVK